MGRQLLHILTLILLTVVANVTQGAERTDNLVTWVYDGTSFTPVAKVAGGERYTIVHDYLGTPTQAYDSGGNLVWEMLLDVYGGVIERRGDRSLVPFRYQGQYEDEETGLYYNRFRYYSPKMGMYISSDPIGLAGNNPTLYGYVQDVNAWLDPWGLLKGYYNGPKPKYENPGHHELGNPNFRGGGNNRTSIIPKNAEDIYKYAIPDKDGKHWYAMDESGEIHRFGNSNNGNVHWNGSSRQGRGIVVPKEVQSRFNNPNSHRKAPKAIFCK